MKRVFSDRSRVETYQRCKRSRYLAYHQDGIGIEPIRKPLPLVVGGSVHVGLAHLLTAVMVAGDWTAVWNKSWRTIEDAAVAAALPDFATHANALELDTLEQPVAPSTESDPALAELVGRGKSQFDQYLALEQASLVEGLVRAYARRRLRPLLEQFEVLEVEREGEWLLSSWNSLEYDTTERNRELWFMSRPDALLRERDTNQLYLLSYKAAASWDVRKARDAEHDMQGLSEGVEVERRLAEWWKICTAPGANYKDIFENYLNFGGPGITGPREMRISMPMAKYLHELDSPPRIHAIRYEYMLKGDRWRDKDLTARFGFEARAQRSVLVRGYMSAGMASGDEQWCHSWDYLKDGGTGETSKLNYRGWRSEPVWSHMPIARWIDMLDDSAMAISGDTGAELGYKSDAQAIGYTATHPLDDVFVPPIVIYRNDDDLRDWIEQLESQEKHIAESVVQVESAADEGERRHQLNVHFPQTRSACEWQFGTTCMFAKICYGGAEIRANPIESGLYKPRQVNHPQEVSK